jgi:potassium-transporting ATPase KdpC subunit
MFKELKAGFLMMVVMTVITGFVYPAVITAIAQVVFPDQANGSLIVSNGQVVGSRLLGQNFTKAEYFHPRPSSAGSGYDPTATAGSNLGPTSAKLLNGVVNTDDKGTESVGFDGIKNRVVHYCVENDVPFESSIPIDQFKDAEGNLDDLKLIKAFNDEKMPLTFTAKTPLPADAVTASASGVDPHISPRNAELQAVRVAKARGASVEAVRAIVAEHTEGRTFGVLGEPHVNVLLLNLALDARFPRK